MLRRLTAYVLQGLMTVEVRAPECGVRPVHGASAYVRVRNGSAIKIHSLGYDVVPGSIDHLSGDQQTSSVRPESAYRSRITARTSTVYDRLI